MEMYSHDFVSIRPIVSMHLLEILLVKITHFLELWKPGDSSSRSVCVLFREFLEKKQVLEEMMVLHLMQCDEDGDGMRQ